MSRQITRRDAIKTTAALGAGWWFGLGTSSLRAQSSPNEKLNLACIGVGGRGADNVGGLASQNFVAFCDVDQERASKTLQKYPGVPLHSDFRTMLDKLEKEIDGVVISTPDHTHFHPAMQAMRMGKHVYCEKPMAHTIWEVREMTKLAAEKKVATQLGVQRHTLNNVHRSVEIVKSGALGKVTEVHAWIGGDRGMPKIPTDTPEVPKHLDWDAWVGPAPMRPYHPTICPYGWRFWWDYGTGETGNWGCHILDIAYWALDLKYPTFVEGSGPPVHELTTPKQMTSAMTFAEQGVKLHWSHAKSGPPILAEKQLDGKGMNTLFIGTDGMLLTGFDKLKLYPEEKFGAFKLDPSIPKSPGFYKEWIEACKGGSPATCEFGYSGPLTETVLLGNVAYRAQGKFAWDAESLRAKGDVAVDHLIAPMFREGWDV